MMGVLDFPPVRYLVSSRLQVFQRTYSDKLQLAAFWLPCWGILQRTLLTLRRAHHPKCPHQWHTYLTYLTQRLSTWPRSIICRQYSSLPDTATFLPPGGSSAFNL
ncbi:hypothetical protein ATANTOWER_007414, partial [Ataeniobius toweri]|nr:hypothetical protein [Ataeniobius toweri]